MPAKRPCCAVLALVVWVRIAGATSYAESHPPIDLNDVQSQLLQVDDTARRGPGSVSFAILAENVRSWKTPTRPPSDTRWIQNGREIWAVEPSPAHIGEYCAVGTAQILAIESLGAAYPRLFRWTLRFWSQPVPSGTRLTLTRPPLHEDDSIVIAYVIGGSPTSFTPGDLHYLFGRLTYAEEIEHPVSGRRVIAPAVIARAPARGMWLGRRAREPIGPSDICRALLVAFVIAMLLPSAVGVRRLLFWFRSRLARAQPAVNVTDGTTWRERLCAHLLTLVRNVRIIPVLIFLALGLATTIGMAWWIAITPPFISLQGTYRGYYIDDGEVLWIYESWTADGKRFGTLAPRLRWIQPKLRTQPSSSLFQELEKLPLPARPRFVSSRGIDDLRERLDGLDIGDYALPRGYRPGPDSIWRKDEEFGCPMLALRHFRIYQENEQSGNWSGWEGGTLLIDSTPGQHRRVPLIPILPGSIVNTLFYALLWATPFMYFGALRRAWRLRKGRCPHCNYDLGDALDEGCPECGWNRANAPMRAPASLS